MVDQVNVLLAAALHDYPGLPPVAELIPEVKVRLFIMMRKCSIDRQTFVVIAVVKSFARINLKRSQGWLILKKTAAPRF